MAQDYELLLQQAKEKLDKSYALVLASLEDLSPYAENKQYTPNISKPMNINLWC